MTCHAVATPAKPAPTMATSRGVSASGSASAADARGARRGRRGGRLATTRAWAPAPASRRAFSRGGSREGATSATGATGAEADAAENIARVAERRDATREVTGAANLVVDGARRAASHQTSDRRCPTDRPRGRVSPKPCLSRVLAWRRIGCVAAGHRRDNASRVAATDASREGALENPPRALARGELRAGAARERFPPARLVAIRDSRPRWRCRAWRPSRPPRHAHPRRRISGRAFPPAVCDASRHPHLARDASPTPPRSPPRRTTRARLGADVARTGACSSAPTIARTLP